MNPAMTIPEPPEALYGRQQAGQCLILLLVHFVLLIAAAGSQSDRSASGGLPSAG